MRPGLAKAALGYFLIVFGAGFALALVRIPVLVPLLGEQLEWTTVAFALAVVAVVFAGKRMPVRAVGMTTTERAT